MAPERQVGTKEQVMQIEQRNNVDHCDTELMGREPRSLTAASVLAVQ
jgi:hypothetical protein